MHTFVAFFPEPSLHAAIAAAETAYAETLPNGTVRWTAGEKRHITFLFVGDLSWRLIGEVREAFQGGERETRSMLDAAPEIVFSRIAPFPTPRRPAAIALLPDESFHAPESLIRRRAEFVQTLDGQGIECDAREWSPHITVAYPRQRRSSGNQTLPELRLAQPIVMQITSVSLVVAESEQGTTRYRKVVTF